MHDRGFVIRGRDGGYVTAMRTRPSVLLRRPVTETHLAINPRAALWFPSAALAEDYVARHFRHTDQFETVTTTPGSTR